MISPITNDSLNTIIIATDEDTIVARMRVREFAREINLDIPSQACVSIAVTSLAQSMGLGSERHGRVEVTSFSNNLNTGIRVDLIVSGPGCQQCLGAIQNQGFAHLLDQIYIRSVPDQELTVTAIKWRGLYYGPYSYTGPAAPSLNARKE